MKLMILHLSDIHTSEEAAATISSQLGSLRRYLGSRPGTADAVVILLTGDIAFSGQDKEYDLVLQSLGNFLSQLQQTFPEVHLVTVPGNHDCDFSGPQAVRDLVVQSLRPNQMSSEFIRTCSSVQEHYRSFCASLPAGRQEVLSEDALFRSLRIRVLDHDVEIHCYNTAWMSQLRERPGRLLFPLERYAGRLGARDSSLTIALMHHTPNWFDPDMFRSFREHLAQTADFVFTGHNHVAASEMSGGLDGVPLVYVEGACFYGGNEGCASGLNTVWIDFSTNTFLLTGVSLLDGVYRQSTPEEKLMPQDLKRPPTQTGEDCALDDAFRDWLTDVGASFSHPSKSRVMLADIFTYPDIRNISFESTATKDKRDRPRSSAQLLQDLPRFGRVLLVGDEKSGKTTFCKVAFVQAKKAGNYPIFLDGSRINSAVPDKLNKLLSRCVSEQYRTDPEQVMQAGKETLLVIIDDLDLARLNAKNRAHVLAHMQNLADHILVTANDLFPAEELLAENSEGRELIKSFTQCQLLQFGHLLRSKLIRKWVQIGEPPDLEDAETLFRHDQAKTVVDTVIGKNLVPAHPIFLLTLLQTMEMGQPHNLRESSYGYYYEYLIMQPFAAARMGNEEIDVFYSFLSELAYALFNSSARGMSEADFADFHQEFCHEYDIRIPVNVVRETLQGMRILLCDPFGDLAFRYRYTYYFFVAHHMANHITDTDVQDHVREMCDALHRTEYANIVMFLTHLSKDPFIVDQIVIAAAALFPDVAPVEFEADIALINGLQDAVPQLVLKAHDVDSFREKSLRRRDEAEAMLDAKSQDDPGLESEEENELAVIDQLNRAVKTVEVLGQLLKNYYGSLKAMRKAEIAEQAYFTGLRSLGVFLHLIREHADGLVHDIGQLLKQRGMADERDMTPAARRLVFGFCHFLAYGFIKKVSASVGTEKLEATYDRVVQKHPVNSVRLIDVSIRLDHFKAFPMKSVRELKERFQGNVLAELLLKQFVIHHLYMFPVGTKNRHRICSLLNIPIEKQLMIGRTSHSRKR